MSIDNTNWTESGTPASTNYTESNITKSTYSETAPSTSQWLRTFETSIPLYDDSTITYDEITEYYDGYNSGIITEDDVKFSAFTEAGLPVNTAWADVS